MEEQGAEEQHGSEDPHDPVDCRGFVGAVPGQTRSASSRAMSQKMTRMLQLMPTGYSSDPAESYVLFHRPVAVVLVAVSPPLRSAWRHLPGLSRAQSPQPVGS